MSDIDPKNLGPKVYKEDQVITKQDLAHIVLTYRNNEEIFKALGDMTSATDCCACHSVAERLLMWLDKGKPTGGKEHGDDKPDSFVD